MIKYDQNQYYPQVRVEHGNHSVGRTIFVVTPLAKGGVQNGNEL